MTGITTSFKKRFDLFEVVHILGSSHRGKPTQTGDDGQPTDTREERFHDTGSQILSFVIHPALLFRVAWYQAGGY